MQVSKIILTCGAATLGLMAFSAAAADAATEAQLREALRQRLSAESGAPPGTPPSVPATVVAPAAPAAVAAPDAPAVVAAPATAVDDAAAARMREALRQRMAEVDAQEAAARASTDRLTEALHQRMAEEPVSTSAVAEAEARQKADFATPSTTPAAAAPVGVLQPQPLETPASPIPASKEQRLAELLAQYKSDQISPQEYHTQRARILAE